MKKKTLISILIKKGILFAFGSYVLVNLISCQKLVSVPLPTDKLVTESVFNNASTATQAILNIYITMAQNNGGESYYLSKNLGLLSDELKNYANDQPNLSFYTNSLLAVNSPGPWFSGYNYIYQSNAIIENLQINEGIAPAIKKQLIGEALFIRGFWHFYLANIYGDVPLALATNYKINTALKKTLRADVFQQSINDLKQAEQMLNDNFVDATDTVTSFERVRPTKWSAKAMLARIYLYSNKYDSAEFEAAEVIKNSATFALLQDLNEVFLANSQEAIWQIQTPNPHNFSTADGYNYILLGLPSTSSYSQGNATISAQLISSFEGGDFRRKNWINYVVPSATIDTFYYPYKYKEQYSPDLNGAAPEYVMVLRLAEQYLIRSEAFANQSKFSEAVTDLNSIRHRAGLFDYPGPMDKLSILNAVLHERQTELFTEWGHRWLDLARTGNINAIMSVVAPLKKGTWNASGYQQLFPIPQSEIQADYNLTQNLGYY